MNDSGLGITRENLLLIVPPALTHDQSMMALASSDAEALAARLAEIDRVRIIPNIEGLDEALLDILARDFKVDWWDADYGLEEKRRTLKTSWQVHKTLGTKAAVEMAASAVYPETRVREWFEYGGEPYRFRLDVDLPEDEWTPEKHKRLMWRMQYYKNLRSHLDSVVYRMKPVILENQQVFWLGALYTHLRAYNYGQEIIRLDGRRRLDGSWLLNQGLIRGPALYQIMARMRAECGSKLSALVKVRAEAGRAGSVHVGGTYRAKGTVRHRAGMHTAVVSTGASNRFSVSAAVTADTMWRLDGTYSLNGEKKLNAKIVRSEL